MVRSGRSRARFCFRSCKHIRADAGESASVCAIAADEWTLQVNGEGDPPSATTFIDNAYADAIELRVDHVSLGQVKPASVSRIHLSPKAHVLAAYSSSGTLREETTQTLAEWKRYVWAPEKRRSYIVEKRDYGASFGNPLLPETNHRIDKAGFFETDADFIFEPFPESIEASAYTVGATRKRLVRVGCARALTRFWQSAPGSGGGDTIRDVESDLLRVFAALEASGAKYLVVGGVAVVLHGHLRVTADVDLVVKLEPANARAAMQALAGLGFRPRAPVAIEDFADATMRKSWIAEKGLTVFSLWNAAMRGTEVDVFVAEPFDFDATYARAIHATIDGVRVSVVALDDLIALKRAAGRVKDEEDIRALLALKNAKD